MGGLFERIRHAARGVLAPGKSREPEPHPLFGVITFDRKYGWWEGQVALPCFADFADARTLAWEQEAGVRDRREGRFDLQITDRGGTGPTGEQEEAFRYLVAHQEAVCRVALEASFDYYRSHLDIWREGEAAPDAVAPRIETPEELKRLVTLTAVYVWESSEDGCAFTAFGFDCSWDMEHGLGVKMHRDRVVDVGEADAAFDE